MQTLHLCAIPRNSSRYDHCVKSQMQPDRTSLENADKVKLYIMKVIMKVICNILLMQQVLSYHWKEEATLCTN